MKGESGLYFSVKFYPCRKTGQCNTFPNQKIVYFSASRLGDHGFSQNSGVSGRRIISSKLTRPAKITQENPVSNNEQTTQVSKIAQYIRCLP